MNKLKCKESVNTFGGDWTELKLNILKRYLKSYALVLKKTSFKVGYIDAFAGSGNRIGQADKNYKFDQDLFDFDPPSESKNFLEGSTQIALRTDPAFDKYIFIEKDKKRCAELENLKSVFPDLAENIHIKNGDANEEIRNLTGPNMSWKSHRAVMFLDPFGTQVEWETIKSIAKTKAIDLWVLFPLGVAVNRFLRKDGNIPKHFRDILDKIFGTKDWEKEFYKKDSELDLFGDEFESVEKVPMEVIARYFIERLNSVFAGVAEKPCHLKNSRGNSLYILCFAVGNPKAKGIALDIANHILENFGNIE